MENSMAREYGAFLSQVEFMRKAQKVYFRTRSTPDLHYAKAHEAKVDAFIAKKNAEFNSACQSNLF